MHVHPLTHSPHLSCWASSVRARCRQLPELGRLQMEREEGEEEDLDLKDDLRRYACYA